MSKESRAVQSGASVSLAEVQIQLLSTAKTKGRARRLLAKHHYLGDVRAVGEQLFYAITAVAATGWGCWSFAPPRAGCARATAGSAGVKSNAAADCRWSSTTAASCCCLTKPFPISVPVRLRLTLDRLSADWQARYGHPVVLVETFVDPEQFCGTVYSANGWQELGATDGFGRVRRDFYVQHNKPKRLFARELCRKARRSLAADKLKPALAAVEAKTRPRSTQSPAQIRSLVQHLKSLPDYRKRIGVYPLWSLVAICVLAHLCGAPRGQKDLAKFAKGLSQAQRRALGVRQQAGQAIRRPASPPFAA